MVCIMLNKLKIYSTGTLCILKEIILNILVTEETKPWIFMKEHLKIKIYEAQTENR